MRLPAGPHVPQFGAAVNGRASAFPSALRLA
jgi:hypothetical protein